MSNLQFKRDNILTGEERAASARKCIQQIRGAGVVGDLVENSYKFFIEQEERSKRISYSPSEKQLAWLRDLHERHVL